MHIGLGKVLAVEDQSPIPEPLTDSAQLKHFAREAEVNRNFELASKYYQEVSSKASWGISVSTNVSFELYDFVSNC